MIHRFFVIKNSRCVLRVYEAQQAVYVSHVVLKERKETEECLITTVFSTVSSVFGMLELFPVN